MQSSPQSTETRPQSIGAQARVDGDPHPLVWFEVEDFLRYFDHFRNPTGSQRVPFEIFVEAQRLFGESGRVRFCRLSIYTRRFMPIGFDEVVSAYLSPPGETAPWKTLWDPARLWSEPRSLLPLIARHLGFFVTIAKTPIRDLIDMVFRPRRFERIVRRGDIIASLGACWGFPRYMEHVAQAKRRFGIRFVTLVYDLIPIENPSLVEQGHVNQFREWISQAILHADMLLTISRHSRDALSDLAVSLGHSSPRVEVLELGTGLSDRPESGAERSLSLPQSYVLFVSTVEIRKNHRLLVRVWRRLLERHGPDAVPVLLFAGRIGWLVEGLLAELAASEYLGGKIQHISDLSDRELRQAYRSCLFTIFPSLCEGWGLPVAESLAAGKFCLASDRTSIPEVGGELVDYFDPTDEDDALAKIERALLDPAYLAAREARVLADYRPRTWRSCVQSLMDKIDPAKSA
jgi:glycosyltransferase involved in cell wall biosynthesis